MTQHAPLEVGFELHRPSELLAAEAAGLRLTLPAFDLALQLERAQVNYTHNRGRPEDMVEHAIDRDLGCVDTVLLARRCRSEALRERANVYRMLTDH